MGFGMADIAQLYQRLQVLLPRSERDIDIGAHPNVTTRVEPTM